MTPYNDRLYQLIPAIYRIRDEDVDQYLRAVLSVISEQVAVVERDIEQLYDNWFIETCDEWVVPYIGQLVGHEAIAPTNGEIVDPHVQERNRWLFPRREIANIVKYRRRKGTLAVLEELAFDVAGWPAYAVEFRNQVASTPDVRSALSTARAAKRVGRLPNLRDRHALAHTSGPFDSLRRLPAFRARPEGNEPRVAPTSVGLWVWRWRVYPVKRTPPAANTDGGVRYFSFDPLGFERPLYNKPVAPKNSMELAEPAELPMQLTRDLLRADMAQSSSSTYYGRGRALLVEVKGQLAHRLGLADADTDPTVLFPIPASLVAVGDLATMNSRPGGSLNEAATAFEKADVHWILIDPEAGRFLVRGCSFPDPCAQQHSHDDIRVSYQYAFGGDLGGGEYDRLRERIGRMASWVLAPDSGPVATDRTLAPVEASPEGMPPSTPLDRGFAELIRRLKWIAGQSRPLAAELRHLVLELTQTGVYRAEGGVVLHIPADCTVEIRAARKTRPVILCDVDGQCGQAPIRVALDEGARLVLDGLVISSCAICVSSVPGVKKSDALPDDCGCHRTPISDISQFVVRHCTLASAGTHRKCHCCDGEQLGTLVIGAGISRVCIDHSILGRIELPDSDGGCSCDDSHDGSLPGRCPPPHVELTIQDSLIQVEDGYCISSGAAGNRVAACELRGARCTFLGSLNVSSVQVLENSIVLGELFVRRWQTGLIRHCYVNDQRINGRSVHPPRVRCLPPPARELLNGETVPSVPETQITLTSDDFAGLRYGQPGFGWLRSSAPTLIRTGADDGSELGVFHDQFTSQRTASLRRRLDEFSPALQTLSLLFAEEHLGNHVVPP